MRNLFRVLSIAVVLALGACGGDSSNEDAALFAAAAQNDKPVEGRAVKGVLQGAAVALRVQAGDALVDYATTVTDDAGVFAFDTFPDEPFKLVVFAPLDGSARMLCDASSGCGDSGGHPLDTNGNGVFDFGEAMPLPSDFSMTAWFAEPPADGALAVTPLTHLAATLAESYPGPVEARSIAVASTTVATLFDLPADFATRWPLSVNDPDELAGAGAADMQHALLAAGFAELATAGEMQAVLDAYAESLAGFGGQLPLSADEGDLEALVEAAVTMAQALLDEGASLSETLAGLQSLVQRWSGTHTQVVTDAEVNPDDMARARVVLDDLDHYLNLANINGQAQFFTDQVGQLDWLYTEATMAFAETTIGAASQIILLAALGDFLAEHNGVSVLDASTEELSVLFDTETRKLSVSKDDETGFVDISVTVQDLMTGAQDGVLEYSLDGIIENDGVAGSMQGSLHIDLNDTALLPVIETAHQLVLENPEVSGEDLADALLAMVDSLHAKATVGGSMALFKPSDPAFAFTATGSAWAELNVPAVSGEGDALTLQISHGVAETPWGDSIYSLGGEAPALHVAVDEDATLDANFGFEAFAMPAMEVQASGRLDNLGVVVRELLSGLDFSGGASDVLALIGELDYSVLDLHGSAHLSIPADARTYLLTLDGLRLDVSLPNSLEQGLQFHLTSLNGGYLYAGDSLVGSVTFDWSRTGVTLYLHDGTVRSYFLGPIDDLIPEEVLSGLLQLAGG